MTPRPKDLVGSYIAAGTVIAEVADTSTMRARVYVSETELHKLHKIYGARLRAQSMWKQFDGSFVGLSPASRNVAPGLMSSSEYTGIHAPVFFTVDLLVRGEDVGLLNGMTGIAKIYGERRSIAASLLRPVFDAAARRIW
jgi:hypothetical protein